MMVRRVMLRGHAWTFSNQGVTTVYYPIIWNISGQQALWISDQWTFEVRQLAT